MYKTLVLSSLAIFSTASDAQVVQFNARSSFESTLGALITDKYESAGYRPSPLTILSDDAMSAVLGQTRYTSLYIPNKNIISSAFNVPDNHFYCAGCNGTFELSFTETSVGNLNGVYGVGFDIYQNEGTAYGWGPMRALLTFGDGTKTELALPELRYSSGKDFVFFGITSSLGIESLRIVNSPNSSASFAIDNLTIGSAIPEPSTWSLYALSFMGLLVAVRRQRGAIQAHASTAAL